MEEKQPVLNLRRDALAENIDGLYGSALTPEEKADARNNLVGFFELLIQIDRRNEEQPDESNNGSSDHAD